MRIKMFLYHFVLFDNKTLFSYTNPPLVYSQKAEKEEKNIFLR